jgi:hypothetical protein
MHVPCALNHSPKLSLNTEFISAFSPFTSCPTLGISTYVFTFKNLCIFLQISRQFLPPVTPIMTEGWVT